MVASGKGLVHAVILHVLHSRITALELPGKAARNWRSGDLERRSSFRKEIAEATPKQELRDSVAPVRLSSFQQLVDSGLNLRLRILVDSSGDAGDS
jgi:hypothetical protein